MDGSSKDMFTLLFVCGVFLVPLAAVEPYSYRQKQTESLNLPEIASTFRRFEENAPTLVKLLQIFSEFILAFVWIIDSCLNACLWILNETVTSCTEFFFSIFGGLFHIMKLLEAVGFGVKFLLEANYAIVSGLFETADFLKKNFNHAITLVKISLANGTDHVYESSSMALERVQDLFQGTCRVMWGNIVLIWEKLQCLLFLLVDKFTGYFVLPLPDVALIASAMVAAAKFFLESIVVTAGVVADGSVFLFRYLGTTTLGYASKFLENVLVLFNNMFKAIIMVFHYMALVVTWPVGVFGNIISKSIRFLCQVWELIVNQAVYLDQSVRRVILLVLHTIIAMAKQTLSFIQNFVPGGIAGLCIAVCIVSGLVIARKNVIDLVVLTWACLRRMNASAQEDIDGDHLVHGNDEFLVDEVVEATDVDHQAETSSASDVPKDRKRLKYELEKERDKRLCVICQDNVKNILLLPCRHVCLCQRCLQEIRYGQVHLAQCPLCRQHIQSTLEVFV